MLPAGDIESFTERSVLGHILDDSERHWPVASASLEVEDFALASHRHLFQEMATIVQSGLRLDMVTLLDQLRRTHKIDAVGGYAYLSGLSEGLVRRPSIESYCDILRERSAMRSQISLGQSLIDGGLDQASPDVTAEHAIAELQRIAGRAKGNRLVQIGEYFNKAFPTRDAYYRAATQTKGLMTGWRKFNEMTGGLQRKELTIIAARPSMGKTTFLVNLANELAVEQNIRTAVSSLEQSSQGILDRLVASRADVDMREMRQGNHIFQSYADRALDEIRRAPLYIDDTSDIGIQQLVATAEILWQQLGGFDVWMVDYLQYIRSRPTKEMNRDQEVGLMCKALRGFARRHNVPVVVLAQLRRDVDTRGDKKPRLGDLRESGNIEQDADTIAFLHRPWYYDREEDQEKMQIIIAKQRNGPVGDIDLKYFGARYRIQDPV